jgi:hypothetical protein
MKEKKISGSEGGRASAGRISVVIAYLNQLAEAGKELSAYNVAKLSAPRLFLQDEPAYIEGAGASRIWR